MRCGWCRASLLSSCSGSAEGGESGRDTYRRRSRSRGRPAGRLTSKLGSYLRPAVLVVDEVGYQPPQRAEANLVFQVILRPETADGPQVLLPGVTAFALSHAIFSSAAARSTASHAPKKSTNSSSQPSTGPL